MHVRLRWWMWLVAVLLLLFTAVIVIRIHGMIRFRETQAELRRLGYATTMEELVAAGPKVDRDRQERCRMLTRWSGAKWMENVSAASPFSELQEQRYPAKDLAKRDQALRDGAADIASIAAVFDEGPVELSLFGWCERDPAKLSAIDISVASKTPLPNLLAIRACATWWATAACLDSDPEPRLRQLDRLVGCMEHPGMLIDAMIGVACCAIRDQAYLWLATRGRLPDLGIWVREASHQRAWGGAGIAGERCVFQEPLIRLRWLSHDCLGISSGFMSDAWIFLKYWPTQGHDAANSFGLLTEAEAELLDRPHLPRLPKPFGYPGIISAIAMPNVVECAATVTEAANRHRMVRCAALVAAAYRREGRLPESLPAEAPAAAIDANLPEQLYERLSACRFRVGIDPAGPLPPAVPAGRWSEKNYASQIGQPASTVAASPQSCRWSLEVDLDAILIPPPERPARVHKP